MITKFKIYELIDSKDFYDFKLLKSKYHITPWKSEKKFLSYLMGNFYIMKYFIYTFKSIDETYFVLISKDTTTKHISISFSTKYVDPKNLNFSYSDSDDFKIYDIMTDKKESIKILSTVVEIVKQFVKKYKAKSIYAVSSEKRNRIYKYIFSKYFNDVKVQEFFEYYKGGEKEMSDEEVEQVKNLKVITVDVKKGIK